MTQVQFVLTRLLKVVLVGSYILLGTILTLGGFGLIPEWGGFFGDTFLHDLWVEPWSIVAAVVWFGIAVLFFNEEESQHEKSPILDEYVHRRYMRNVNAIQDHLAKENLQAAVDLLALTVEDLADQLNMKEV